jgi:hypothetical protein
MLMLSRKRGARTSIGFKGSRERIRRVGVGRDRRVGCRYGTGRPLRRPPKPAFFVSVKDSDPERMFRIVKERKALPAPRRRLARSSPLTIPGSSRTLRAGMLQRWLDSGNWPIRRRRRPRDLVTARDAVWRRGEAGRRPESLLAGGGDPSRCFSRRRAAATPTRPARGRGSPPAPPNRDGAPRGRPAGSRASRSAPASSGRRV